MHKFYSFTFHSNTIFLLMIRSLLLGLITLCCVGISWAQQSNSVQFVEYDLDNGLHVILHEDHSTPIVAVTVLYHVGSKNEDPQRTGFAHFFEHLMFEGSKHIERGQYDKFVTGAGGALNANTSFDRTFYYELLPSNQLELGLWMEAERMLHAKVDSIGVETQREVVKEERRQRVDNQPYGSLLEETFSHAFTKHPYRWTPIGSVQYIDQATLDEFMDFYEVFYVPNNATLSIAGDLDIEETKAWIEKYFGSIPKGTREIPRPEIAEPPLEGEVRDTIYDNVQLPLVLQAYRTPAQGTEDYYAVSLLSTLLTGGQSSVLYKELVDKQQKALFVQSLPLPTEDPGLTFIFSLPNMGEAPESLEASIEEILDNIRKEGISERAFQKVRNQMESEFVTSNSTMAGIAESLADYHVYYGDADLINTEIERYMKVTREDIHEAAKKYFHKDNRVVLYYLPKPNEGEAN